jgi:hypothetical protein
MRTDASFLLLSYLLVAHYNLYHHYHHYRHFRHYKYDFYDYKSMSVPENIRPMWEERSVDTCCLMDLSLKWIRYLILFT